MNPLDWTGPEFLIFYIPYGLCIVALAWLARRLSLAFQRRDTLPNARWAPGIYPREADAPVIAFLRGGHREAVRTLLSRLVGLGLVKVEGRQVRVRSAGPNAPALQPIERDAWGALDHSTRSAADAESRVQKAVAPHLQEMSRMLADQGLLTGDAQKTTLRRLLAVTWLAVGGLGLLKLVVGLARGRTNVGFLILLLIGFTFLIFRLLKLPRRLPAGDRYLSWLQEAYSGLRRPIEIGQQDSARDLALAAGIYGLAAVPALLPLGMAFDPSLAPRRRADSGGGGGSSSSSDGGGDGGGGDGGGGGCGGCGGGGD